MSHRLYALRGIDPLLFRDGRPFAAEPGALAARTLPLPLPATIAGALRTRMGERSNWDWKADGPDKALLLPVAGPLLLRKQTRRGSGSLAPTSAETILFPAPADAIVMRADDSDETSVIPLRPTLPPNSGSNLPAGLEPLLRPLDATQAGKPITNRPYWPLESVTRWLLSPTGREFSAPQPPEAGPPQEERVHIAMNPTTGIAEEGMLFTTRLLCPERHAHWTEENEPVRAQEWAYLTRVGADTDLAGPLLLGGERRLAILEGRPDAEWPTCPPELQAALSKAHFVRMVLVTPALFEPGGWLPAWSGSTPAAPLAALNRLRLRLVAAAVKRREPVGGWDYRLRAPKPLRWMAPAGSVYFFERLEGDPSALAKSAWLAPVSDDEQSRRDGFGLALWGLWERAG